MFTLRILEEEEEEEGRNEKPKKNFFYKKNMILGNGVKWNLKKDYEYNILKKLIHKNINY